MNTLARLVGVALVVTLTAGPAATADPKKGPISEADLLKLIDLGIPDRAITDRLADGGVDFAAEDAIFKRLEKAGASAAVLAAVKKAARPAVASAMALWVKKNYESWDCPLHSDLSINGKPIGNFSADSDRDVGAHLKPGWNTIALTTRAPGPTDKDNHLIFRLGPVARKDGKQTMTALWEFRNGTDWKFADGKYTHQLGPDTKEVTLTYRVYFAGLAAENRPVAAGDYVLSGQQNYASWNVPVTGTVFVNGEPVNTFLGRERQVVITSYLRKGENVIKLVSHRVPDAIADNDLLFKVGGPAEYNVTRGRFELKPVNQFEARTGWKKHEKTGQLVNQDPKGNPDTIEREVKFTLDHEPGKK